MTQPRSVFRLALIPLAVLAVAAFAQREVAPRVVRLDPAVRDSMSTIFARFNRGWDQQQDLNTMDTHVGNFLDCMVSRNKPTLDVETAAHAQVLITMAVQSYRQGKVLYFDEQKFKIVDKNPKA